MDSIFKFKKVGINKIGDFNAVDESEWTLLIKPQIQDVTLFVHYHKMWNVEEKSAEVDADGNETKKAVEKTPQWLQSSGFIKDDKFIVTQQKPVHRQTFHEIQKVYIQSLTNFIEQGYKKDWNNYVGDVPQKPTYYINEKTSQEEASAKVMQNMVKMQTAMSGTTVPNPVQKINKVFKTLKLSPNTVGGSGSSNP